MRILLLPLFLGFGALLQAQTILPVKQNNKWGFINLEGKVIIEPAYDDAAVFKQGYAVVGINGKKGVIDSTGKLVIPAEYNGAEPLAPGYFALRKGKWSLADLNGNVYGNFNYDIIKSLDHRSIQLIDSGRSYLFHIPTNHMSENSWDRIEILEKGKWYGVWQQGKIGVADSMHAVFIQPLLTEKLLYENSHFVLKNGARYSFFDKKGQPVMHDRAWLFYTVIHPDVLVVYDKPSELTLLNLRDHKLILAHEYHQYRVLNDEWIVCVKDHLEGLANWNGDILVPNEYQSIAFYSADGMLRMKKGDKTGIINSNGKILIPAEYNYIDPFDKYGRAVAAKGERMGILSKSGNTIIPFSYDNLVIEEDFIKAYSGQAMDLYTLNTRGLPEEKMHYDQVQSVQLSNRYRPQKPTYFDRKDSINFNYSNRNGAETNGVSQDGLRFHSVSKPIQYNAQSKIKCIIRGNQDVVDKVYGVYDTLRKRRMVEPEYWDIQTDELNTQKWARIILPGGRQGLMNRSGSLKMQYPVKKGTRNAPTNIAYIGPFSHGLARINVGGALMESYGSDAWRDPRPSLRQYGLSVNSGAWGFIDSDGDMQIPAEYTYLSDFTAGRSIACKDGKYGVIDTLNHFVIPLKYDNISYLPGTEEKYFRLEHREQRCGLLDSNGHVVLKADYEAVGYPSEGLVPVRLHKLWGFVDLNGTIIVQPEYEIVYPFSEGLAMVKKKGLWGFVDHSGRLVVECKYGSALEVSEGKIAVRLQGKWGYLDKTGKMIIPNTFNKATSFKNGMAACAEKGKWGVMDAHGKWVIHPAYDKILLSENGYFRLVKKGHYHLANAQGKMLHHVNYESIGEFHEGMAVVKEKMRYGYIDTTGKLVIPVTLIKAKNFSEGLAIASDKNKLGYINKSGVFEIEAKYVSVGEFHEGIALVILFNEVMAIDRHGNVLWQTGETTLSGYFSEGYALIGNSYYNQNGQAVIRGVHGGSTFKNGIAVASFGGSEAVINPSGEHLADFQSIQYYKRGYAPYSLLYTYGIADINGKLILEPMYQKINPVTKHIFLVENFERIGYITSDGKWIWQPTK